MTSSVEQLVSKEQIQAKLKALAEEISSNLSQLEGLQRKEVLSDFVSDLFLSVAKQDQQEVRRQRRAGWPDDAEPGRGILRNDAGDIYKGD